MALILSDKYIAGFVDADGSIGINVKENGRRIVPVICIVQKTSRDIVLSLINQQFGGHLQYRTDGWDRTMLHMNGKKHLSFLERIVPHLILKQALAREIIKTVRSGATLNDIDREALKAFRLKSGKHRNAPPRKWLAGYIDGDGCFTGRIAKSGSFRPKLKISAAEHDRQGVELIKKVYGGSIAERKSEKHTDIVQYDLYLSPSKAKAVLPNFVKHLILKKDQAKYILRCVDSLGYQNGRAIKQMLKHLKAQAQRLSEAAA